MDCWTRVRVRHEQPCPDRPIDTPPIAAAAAMFRSGASSKITCGLLPPNSRETRLMPLPETSRMCSPTRRLPVKWILSTPGWVISASPTVGPVPSTRLKTPLGTPASSSSSVRRKTVRLAYSEGFMTTVHPAASAGATFLQNRLSGAFHGRIAATTPTGSRSVIASTSSAPPGSARVWPPSLSIHPA